MKYSPHRYQDYATQQIIQKPAAGLFLGMGMGKTVSTLTAINELMHDYFEVEKVLVIAPKRVAEDTWTQEAAKWDHLQDLRISRVLGSAKERESALRTPADVYVINRENVPWLVDRGNWDFDFVVIDELSSFKSPSAKRFKALRKVRKRIKRIVGLTGTPSPNGLIDLWPQLYLLDQGERLGKTLGGYRERYFLPDKRNAMVVYSWKLREGSEKAIQEKISDICVSMTAADYLELPERLDIEIPVRLPPKAKALYTQMEKEMLLALDESTVVALTAATLINKLLQMANGAVYDDEKGVQHIHDAKLEALEDLVEQANGNPVLVFYSYKHDRERIMQRFPDAQDLDTAAWNNGQQLIALAHPASAGHGLNLQNGGHIAVWFGLPWSLELYEQANARLHRQGQTETVRAYHLITEGTADEQVMQALRRKAVGQNELIEALKARLK